MKIIYIRSNKTYWPTNGCYWQFLSLVVLFYRWGMFLEEFCLAGADFFSIGSNDLTQLTLGVDRDSEIVAPIFDERNAAVKKLIAQVIAVCRAKKRKIGICGQAPSDYPEFAQFLVEQGIDSISLNPDTVLKTTLAILEKEKALAK